MRHSKELESKSYASLIGYFFWGQLPTQVIYEHPLEIALPHLLVNSDRRAIQLIKFSANLRGVGGWGVRRNTQRSWLLSCKNRT
jgi:hypothetical protein